MPASASAEPHTRPCPASHPLVMHTLCLCLRFTQRACPSHHSCVALQRGHGPAHAAARSCCRGPPLLFSTPCLPALCAFVALQPRSTTTTRNAQSCGKCTAAALHCTCSSTHTVDPVTLASPRFGVRMLACVGVHCRVYPRACVPACVASLPHRLPLPPLITAHLLPHPPLPPPPHTLSCSDLGLEPHFLSDGMMDSLLQFAIEVRERARVCWLGWWALRGLWVLVG